MLHHAASRFATPFDSADVEHVARAITWLALVELVANEALVVRPADDLEAAFVRLFGLAISLPAGTSPLGRLLPLGCLLGLRFPRTLGSPGSLVWLLVVVVAICAPPGRLPNFSASMKCRLRSSESLMAARGAST